MRRAGRNTPRRVVASRLLDTIPPLTPRYAAHDISEWNGAHFSPAGGQEQKEKDLRAISPSSRLAALSLTGNTELGAFRLESRPRGRPIDRRRRAPRRIVTREKLSPRRNEWGNVAGYKLQRGAAKPRANARAPRADHHRFACVAR